MRETTRVYGTLKLPRFGSPLPLTNPLDNMAYYDGPEDSLAGNLDLAIGAYADERLGYWSDDPEGSHMIKVCDLIAFALQQSSMDLLFTSSEDEGWKKSQAPWAEVTRIAEEQGMWQHLSQSVEICIATDSVNSLFESTSRCLDLAKCVISHPPGEPVRRYLARLGRCYIAGFLPECVMLCRAVLENSVQEAFARRGSRDCIGGWPEKMRPRLKKAETVGWLDRKGRADAETIWLRGNTAVHDDPEATSDVLGTIIMTMGVLEQLYSDI